MTQRLEVRLGERSYPILVGPGLLAQPAVMAEIVGQRDLMVVSNPTVAPLWLPALRSGLAGQRLVECILPDGEAHKTLAAAQQVLDALVTARFNRDCRVLALGGGVVGDIAGFAAACYQRGVDFVQLPTTLLAQVDSSVGGKTGVNHPGGKNLIGAFHQPRAVVADTSTLGTLPPRELRAGFAEVIKAALLADARFFDWLEEHAEAVMALENNAVEQAILRSCEIKARIVAADEREQGQRALLNLGHSFGHAIETCLGYGKWLHGEAVAVGLVLAANLSVRQGTLAVADARRIDALLSRVGLPVSLPELPAGRLLELMGMDKKVRAGKLNLVLLSGIGKAYCTADVGAEALAATLAGD